MNSNPSAPGWDKNVFFEKEAMGGRYAGKAARTAVYTSNCGILKAGAYTADSGKVVRLDASAMSSGTVFYDSPVQAPQGVPYDEPVKTGAINMDCISLARHLQLEGYNPVILNLADAYIACGWYYKGSFAQEESLCRQSTLSQSLYPYYKKSFCDKCGVAFKGTRYPMDINWGAVYTPHATVFRKGAADGYELLEEPFEMAFVSCAALNFSAWGPDLGYRSADGGFTPEGDEIMRNKVRTIYRASLHGGHDTMVLGAFGCGAFHLRPDRVAAIFRDVLQEDEFKDRFRLVCFAILDREGGSPLNGKFAPFYKVFGTLDLAATRA